MFYAQKFDVCWCSGLEKLGKNAQSARCSEKLGSIIHYFRRGMKPTFTWAVQYKCNPVGLIKYQKTDLCIVIAPRSGSNTINDFGDYVL